MKKFFAVMVLVVSVVFALGLTGCGCDDGGEVQTGGNFGGADLLPEETESAEAEPEIYHPLRDLGGMEIVVATWWSSGCTETAEPENDATRARWQHRREMEERYNFRVRYVRYGSWRDVSDSFKAEITAENRDYTVWMLAPAMFARGHEQGLFAPISMHHLEGAFVAARDEDGVPHGFTHEGQHEARPYTGGIYFNMRLFEETGFPHDFPFILQAEGNWTWEIFTQVLYTLVPEHMEWRDIDGWLWSLVHDDFAAFFNAALASNDAAFSTPRTPEFLQTEDWFAHLANSPWPLAGTPQSTWPEPPEYRRDFALLEFNAGSAPMLFTTDHTNIDPLDRWGFVPFPQGPNAAPRYSLVHENIYAIPRFFSPEEIDDIMFALQLWYQPLEVEGF